jgi:hypothetical protein
MELCDQSLIEQLNTTSEQSCVRSAAETSQTNRRNAAAHCRCGHCPMCAQNARWERIFLERFSDPTYYAPRPVRHMSSLDYQRKA